MHGCAEIIFTSARRKTLPEKYKSVTGNMHACPIYSFVIRRSGRRRRSEHNISFHGKPFCYLTVERKDVLLLMYSYYWYYGNTYGGQHSNRSEYRLNKRLIRQLALLLYQVPLLVTMSNKIAETNCCSGVVHCLPLSCYIYSRITFLRQQ